MTPEEWEKVSEIFHSALDLEPEKRPAFLDRACGEDSALRREVESLLSANEEINDFIASPAVDLGEDSLPELPSLTGAYFAHYRIDKSVGRGGMGEVYLATDTRLGRQVAIKKLPDRFLGDPVFLKRFHNEARAAATLNHPHIATIYSVEEFDGKPFITMEYVEGKTLDALTPAGGLELAVFLDWFISLAKGFRHAHERGVTHRDIKPGNIMVTPEGLVKILDFGLAQVNSIAVAETRTTITLPGQIMGTPSYMSPEQAEGREIDHRADIFSFGVLMYEALTGCRPFTGDSNAEVISNLLKSEPTPVSDLRRDLPPLVARVIKRCLRKRRRDRIQSMQEIATLLGEAQALMKRGASYESFGRRLYRETTSSGTGWRIGAAALVPFLAIAGWYYFSGSSRPSISFERMSMRRLSDTNNVGYTEISPDGKSIAYATFEPNGNRALWIRRIDDRNPLQLVEPDLNQYWGGLAFSPDGGQVFYITADRTDTYGTLYRVSSLGGPSRKLSEYANDVGGVSPDGERILFVRYGDPSRIISAKTLDGTEEEVILEGSSRGIAGTINFRDPEYSPDGRSVYFIQLTSIDGVEEWSLNQISLSDHSVKSIFKQPERISELAVLPNSEGILVTAVDPVSNLQQVFCISPSDGTKTRLTNDLFYYFGVSIDRKGSNIVASQRSSEQRVWVGDAANPASLKQLNQEPNAHQTVDWTPDGRIVYDGYENNVAHIWISDPDGRNLQKLSLDESDDSQPIVSGDGRFIVFTSKRSGRTQVWRMNIDGSGQVLLANLDGVTMAPRFASDGQTVVFQWLRDKGRSLMSVPVSGGDIQEVRQLEDVPLNNSYYWAASPDGKFIAHSLWDRAESRMKVAIDPIDPALKGKAFSIWPSLILKWTPDGKSIYYREHQLGYQPESEILKIDVASGRSSVMLSTAPEYIVDLSYSRDGKRLALVRGRNTSNAVMLSSAPQAGQ